VYSIVVYLLEFIGKPDVVRQLEISLSDYNAKYACLELLERGAVRTALLEERSHYCFLVRCLKPVMVCLSVEIQIFLGSINDVFNEFIICSVQRAAFAA